MDNALFLFKGFSMGSLSTTISPVKMFFKNRALLFLLSLGGNMNRIVFLWFLSRYIHGGGDGAR